MVFRPELRKNKEIERFAVSMKRSSDHNAFDPQKIRDIPNPCVTGVMEGRYLATYPAAWKPCRW
jgi:hypothetical protein